MGCVCVWGGVTLRWPSLLSGEGYGLGEVVTFSLTHISASQALHPGPKEPQTHGKHLGVRGAEDAGGPGQ